MLLGSRNALDQDGLQRGAGRHERPRDQSQVVVPHWRSEWPAMQYPDNPAEYPNVLDPAVGAEER